MAGGGFTLVGMTHISTALDAATSSIDAIDDPAERLDAARDLLTLLELHQQWARKTRAYAIGDLRARRWRWAEIAARAGVSVSRVRAMIHQR